MRTGGSGTGNPLEDEFLRQLYQQVTELQAARFGADYDHAAGADRFRAWLSEHTAADQASRGAAKVSRSMPLQAGQGMTGEAAASADRGGTLSVGETTQGPGGIRGAIPGVRADWDADRAVTALYSTHYSSLVRLAALLVGDTATAEEVVQDSFVALHASWRRLRDGDSALSYLRQSVVNHSRSAVHHHRIVADRNMPEAQQDKPSAEEQAIAAPEYSQVISALRALPTRQREVLVMRHYADLSDAQIAEIMGISKSAVRRHALRAMASLRAALDPDGTTPTYTPLTASQGSVLPLPFPATNRRPGTRND